MWLNERLTTVKINAIPQPPRKLTTTFSISQPAVRLWINPEIANFLESAGICPWIDPRKPPHSKWTKF